MGSMEQKSGNGEQGDRMDALSRLGEPYHEENEDLQRAYDLWYMSDQELARFNFWGLIVFGAVFLPFAAWFIYRVTTP